MTQMHMHKMFHSRRKNRDGTSFTKKLAAQRRLDLAAFVMMVIPGDELMQAMTAPRPPSISELVTLAQQYAAKSPCPHCGGVLPLPTTT
jgi:hypothetical protein